MKDILNYHRHVFWTHHFHFKQKFVLRFIRFQSGHAFKQFFIGTEEMRLWHHNWSSSFANLIESLVSHLAFLKFVHQTYLTSLQCPYMDIQLACDNSTFLRAPFHRIWLKTRYKFFLKISWRILNFHDLDIFTHSPHRNTVKIFPSNDIRLDWSTEIDWKWP